MAISIIHAHRGTSFRPFLSLPLRLYLYLNRSLSNHQDTNQDFQEFEARKEQEKGAGDVKSQIPNEGYKYLLGWEAYVRVMIGKVASQPACAQYFVCDCIYICMHTVCFLTITLSSYSSPSAHSHCLNKSLPLKATFLTPSPSKKSFCHICYLFI